MKTLHGRLSLPSFLPDGTVGVVRGVDSKDLEEVKVEGIVVSTFHLLVHGVKKDLHKIMDWQRPILTDSGGFQIFSLLKSHPSFGKITKDGFIFKWNERKINFTPEVSIKLQLSLGSDILICLDECTDPSKELSYQKKAVLRTVNWAIRCKREFVRLTKGKKEKPLLFAVIQGGSYKSLRKLCTKELIKIGFDGYCYGGWPVDEGKNLLEEILEYTASLMPDDLPKYALGVGKPRDIVKCVGWGYNLFDCVIPTREARHKRLYRFKDSGLDYELLRVNLKLAKDKKSISEKCDCPTCQNYSRQNLFELFKAKDTLALRLATIHNLRFYTSLMEKLGSKTANKLS